MTGLDKFIDCMEYNPGPRPNYELGVWAQTRQEWTEQSPEKVKNFGWNWFESEDAIGLDHREYIDVNYGFFPPFEYEVLEENDRYIISRNSLGVVTKALKEGTVDNVRMCMDEYLEFPIKKPEDFANIKKRLTAGLPQRYPADLDKRIRVWETRDYPLVLGRNCAANGFYWRAREWLGTENLSYAWYDYPEMMHEMMEFFADFIIETSRPVLEKINVEYFCLNEDMSMKSGPLLGPDTFKEFIFPHLKRLIDFFKSHGTKYIVMDSDGNPEQLIPLLLDAGVDVLWPLERASDVNPLEWRKKFGRQLRMWGGVDKRVLAQGPADIKKHLREFIPLIEEGGFIPHVDHLVQPGVTLDNFMYYMDCKRALLEGNYATLD
ncbi:MAG TPA: uroporphyrinogen decarboxylase family protein [Phycisphaerae bacterium]|nr:uroporphyrinogen decarboxylase family protein [Phycisphaerae bacterium]